MIEKKKYCLDTSGLSNPLDLMPETKAIYQPIWNHIKSLIVSGVFAVNAEIYEELCRLPGSIGEHITANEGNMLLEVGEAWDWRSYLAIVESWRVKYKDVISEYNGNRKGTVGLIDVSIVALAKCLGLPVVSMESISFQASDKKVRIPSLCALEGVEHLTFNDLLS